MILISGAYLEHVYVWEGRWKGHQLDNGHPKNQPHQIILSVDLTALKFNDILTMGSARKQPYIFQ